MTTVGLPDGWTVEYRRDDSEYSIREGDALSARMERTMVQGFSWPGHEVEVSLATSMSCDAETFTIWNESIATLDGRLHFREETTSVVPRGL